MAGGTGNHAFDPPPPDSPMKLFERNSDIFLMKTFHNIDTGLR